MKKLATKLALGLLAACSVGMIAAPAAHAELVIKRTPAEFWVVRLDPATSQVAAQPGVKSAAVGAQMVAARLDLPEDLKNAAFYSWVANSDAAYGARKYGPGSCIETRMPVKQDNRYRYASGTIHRHCPWTLPSVERKWGYSYSVVQR